MTAVNQLSSAERARFETAMLEVIKANPNDSDLDVVGTFYSQHGLEIEAKATKLGMSIKDFCEKIYQSASARYKEMQSGGKMSASGQGSSPVAVI